MKSVLLLPLLLCFVSISAAGSEVGLSGLDEVMAVPEGYFFSVAGDPNYSSAMTVAVMENKAIGSLVKAYKQTNDERYARRLALVLYRFCLDFKSFILQQDRDNGYEISPRYDPADGIEMLFVQGYLAVRDTAAVKKLSSDINLDVAKAIEYDLIRSMVDFVMQTHRGKQVSNDIAKIGLVGRAIDEPEYVRAAYRYLSEFHNYNGNEFGEGFCFDMHSADGLQRHNELMQHVDSIFAAIEGYSDPPDYKDKGGRRLRNISIKDFPYIEKMRAVPAKYALPDGQMNLVGDSTEAKVSEPLTESTNVTLAGFGHAVLGGGKDSNQSQVQLHFSEHLAKDSHRDCLSMVWYGQGRQMSGEIGLQRNKLASWSSSTLSHNTVVINRENQSGTDTFGNVVMYVSDIEGLSVIQVDGANVYRGAGAKIYRRTIIHNTLDENRPYFVDVFEVEGGATHDYSVHGSVFGDMIGECSLIMKRMGGERPMLEDGEKWVEPWGLNQAFNFPSSKYGLILDVDMSKAYEDFSVTFAYEDDKTSGTRIHMSVDPSMEVFLGTSPALRLAGDYSDEQVYNWKMPHLIARRTGEQGLTSTFVAVYDMFKGGPKIKSVKRLISSNAYVALEITLDNRTDKLLYSPAGARSMIGGAILMKGRLGLVCEKDGVSQGYLIGGTILKKSPLMVRSKKSAYSGKILTAARKDEGGGSSFFTVDTILPAGMALRDKWMIVTHPMGAEITENIENPKPNIAQRKMTHAYQIDRVEREGVKMVVYLKEDHGLDINGDKTTELFSQRRVFTGVNSFVIYTHANSLSR